MKSLARWVRCIPRTRPQAGAVVGRSWVNAEGKALYYTVAIREPLAQPATLPLLASLAVRTQLKLRYGVDCQIKWPNDLLLNGKKIVGILCEGVSYGYQQQGRGILCGIGINLAQPQSYFDAAGLPNGTSLALQGAKVDLSTDPAWLAEGLTDFGFDRNMYVFARDGFAPFREEYKAACVNLGRPVDLRPAGRRAGCRRSRRCGRRGPSGGAHRQRRSARFYRRSIGARHLWGRVKALFIIYERPGNFPRLVQSRKDPGLFSALSKARRKQGKGKLFHPSSGQARTLLKGILFRKAVLHMRTVFGSYGIFSHAFAQISRKMLE